MTKADPARRVSDGLDTGRFRGGHELIGDPTYADAILDRILHNAHRIELDGETMRKTRSRAAKKE